MKFYSDEDKREWLEFHFTGSSLNKIVEIFKEKNPGRQKYPDKSTFSRLVNKFNKTGSIKRKEVKNKKKTVLTPEKVQDILGEIQANPIRSTRKLAQITNIGRFSAWNALKKTSQTIQTKIGSAII